MKQKHLPDPPSCAIKDRATVFYVCNMYTHPRRKILLREKVRLQLYDLKNNKVPQHSNVYCSFCHVLRNISSPTCCFADRHIMLPLESLEECF